MKKMSTRSVSACQEETPKCRNILFLVAKIAVVSVLVVSSAQAQQFQQFEDDGSQQTFSGSSVHVCPGGAMFGVDASNNRFLCMKLDGLGSAIVDTQTQMTFAYGNKGHVVHVCPAGLVMVGWHERNNWLICAPSTTFPVVPYRIFPDANPINPIYFTDNGSSAPEPAHSGSSMHICDQDRQHAVMVGIDQENNVLICRSDAIPTPPPFNLIVSDNDAAGFPLNPRWAANLVQKSASERFVPNATPYCLDQFLQRIKSDPRCTTDPIQFNVKGSPDWGGPSGAFCWPDLLGGHVNWRTLIGSRALVVYGDVDGPSAANNRPWSRK